MGVTNEEMKKRLAAAKKAADEEERLKKKPRLDADAAQAKQAADEKFYFEHGVRDDDGKKVDKWEYAGHYADNVRKAERNSTMDWASTMLHIVAMYAYLSDAMDYSGMEMYRGVFNIAGRQVDQQILQRVKDANNKYLAKMEPYIPPEIYQHVTMDNGVLKVKPLEFQNPKFSKAQGINDLFKEGVEVWLKERKCTLRGDKYYDEYGLLLNKEKFEKLKNNEHDGLSAWLSSELSAAAFEERPPISRL